jgi:hypothetical protein
MYAHEEYLTAVWYMYLGTFCRRLVNFYPVLIYFYQDKSGNPGLDEQLKSFPNFFSLPSSGCRI